MKNEKNVMLLKALEKSLIGFIVGTNLLMLSYFILYLIIGSELFSYEISQLQDIKIFISQIVFAGIAYFLVFINFQMCTYLQNKNIKEQYLQKHPYKFWLALISITLITVIIIDNLLGNDNIYSKNISTINGYLWLLIYMMTGLIFAVRDIKYNSSVKKINKKLKELNIE